MLNKDNQIEGLHEDSLLKVNPSSANIDQNLQGNIETQKIQISGRENLENQKVIANKLPEPSVEELAKIVDELSVKVRGKSMTFYYPFFKHFINYVKFISYENIKNLLFVLA